MKVILRADVASIGRKGDILDVPDGFARNYLMPQGLALRATKGAVAQAASMREARGRRDARDRESADELAARLGQLSIRVPARAGADGRLFGSVTTTDIVEAVAAQSQVELDRRKLHLDEPIRAVGVHRVPLRLHPEVEVELSVEVTPQQ